MSDAAPTPQVDALFAELGEPDNRCPADWWAFGACGAVAVAPGEKEQRPFIGELHRYAVARGFPLRIPHPSVSAAGLWNELDVATSHGATPGLLVLDSLEEWKPKTLERLAKRIRDLKLPVTVVGLTNRYQQDPEEWEPEIHSHVDALAKDLPIIYLDQLGTTVPSVPRDELSEADLGTINRHRRGLGMPPIDVGAGWTLEELRGMAEQIRATGRTHNPALKRRLLR